MGRLYETYGNPFELRITSIMNPTFTSLQNILLPGNAINNTLTTDPHNPWFVLFLVLGILTAMLQVPSYLRRAHIGEAANFLELYAVMRMAKQAGNFAFGPSGIFTKLAGAASRTFGSDKNLITNDSLPTGSAGNIMGFFNQGAGRPTGAEPPVQGRAGQQLAVPALAGAGVGTTTSVGAVTNPLAMGAIGALAAAGPVGRRLTVGAPTSSEAVPSKEKDPFEEIVQGRHDNPHDVIANFRQNKIRTGAVDLRYNSRPGNQMRFDEQGNIQQILRDPALENKPVAEKAVVTGFQEAEAAFATVQRDASGREDPRAAKAVSDTLKDKSLSPFSLFGLNGGGINAPLHYRLSSWLAGNRTPEHFRALEESRLERAKTAVRVSGAHDYWHGRPGNYYTKYLNDKFGPITQEDRDRVAYAATNPDAASSGFNDARWQTIGNLARSGINIDGETIGAGSMLAVNAMRQGEFKEAVPAVAKLIRDTAIAEGLVGRPGHEHEEGAVGRVMQESVASGLDPKSREYKQRLSTLKMAAHEGVRMRLAGQQVRAAQAIHKVAGLHNVTPGMVDAVVAAKDIGEKPENYENAVQSIASVGKVVNFGSTDQPLFGDKAAVHPAGTYTIEMVPYAMGQQTGSVANTNLGELGTVRVPVHIYSDEVSSLASIARGADLHTDQIVAVAPHVVRTYAVRKSNQPNPDQPKTIDQIAQMITQADIHACQEQLERTGSQSPIFRPLNT